MKFATVQNGTRDGKLVLVNRALSRALPIPHIAETLQYFMDHFQELEAKALEEFNRLEAGQANESIPFAQEDCHSPLPRAYQWLDGSAYLNHVELVRKARGAEMPDSFLTDPLMYQGGSDAFLPPHESFPLGSEDYGADMEAEVAAIVDDVPMGTSAEEALKHIKLLMIVNDMSLRELIPSELAKGFGFVHGKPSSSFGPVAVTPDELGSSWKDAKIHLPLNTYLNGKLIGNPNAGCDMNFSLAELIAHAAKTRCLSAGTIVGSGTVSNRDRNTGVSCLAEKRMIEKIESGAPVTPFMKFGDVVKIEMLDNSGKSIFGAIEQKIVAAANVQKLVKAK
ncbi:MAG: fumarylacetoacetate hydrolase family protein [Candidatus Obscuribacterales bacterium]|nr:fumarylacetoacetate hydrolase family protein [Candidatus Obscuribacterales bacterium]